MNSKRIFRPAELAGDDLVPLQQRSEYAEPLQELQALKSLHATKERERQKLLARARGERTKRTAEERAQDLLRGAKVDPTPVPDALAALDEELGILRAAIGEKTRQLDAISANLSHTEKSAVTAGIQCRDGPRV